MTVETPQDVPIDYEMEDARRRVVPIDPTSVQCNEASVFEVEWLTPFSVRVIFAQPMLDTAELREPDNYVFTPDPDNPILDPRERLPIVTATPEAVTSPTYVTLTTEEQTDGQDYVLDIKTFEAA